MGGKHWALQAGTSHDLGDHFGRVFDIRFLDRDGERKFAHSTSFGLSHRVVGATIMVHGDAAGLKLPPLVAPVQVVIVPIWRDEAARQVVAGAVAEAEWALAAAQVRVKTDWRDDHTPGFKFNEWELKGVPLRLEIGPRDVAAGQVTLVRRDTREKQAVPAAALASLAPGLLREMQQRLFEAAATMRAAHAAEVDDWAALAGRVAANAGWSLVHWCGGAACEARLKAETKATIRCIPRDLPAELGVCIACGAASAQRVIVARAY